MCTGARLRTYARAERAQAEANQVQSTIAALSKALAPFPEARLAAAVAVRMLDPGSERPLIELKPVEAA